MLLIRLSLVIGVSLLWPGCTTISTPGHSPTDVLQQTTEATTTADLAEATPVAILASPSPSALPTATVLIVSPTPSPTPTVSSGPVVSNRLIERVSVDSDGSQAANPDVPPDASSPAVSADGRFIAFASRAADLVADDTNGVEDVFVHDRQTDQTERVSVASDGSQAGEGSLGPGISADGRYVTFQSSGLSVEGNSQSGIFIHDRQTGQTELVSLNSEGVPADGLSHTARISANGQFVVFVSEASNLVANDPHGWLDIFVRDRQTGQTERVNVASDGTQSNGWSHYPTVSADGRLVAYVSDADNLVADDTNGNLTDVFVYDRLTQAVERIYVDLPCEIALISADGRWVALIANGRLFLHNRQSGETEPIRGRVTAFDLSADGRYVAFATAGEAQILVYDQQTRETVLISMAIAGTPSYGFAPSISADGRTVAFISLADNLVADDTNESFDIFVYERIN